MGKGGTKREGEGIPLPAIPVASACFPANVFVDEAGTGPVRMADFRVRVATAPSKAIGAAGPADEPEVPFSCRDAASVASYGALTAAGVRVLIASAGHLV